MVAMRCLALVALPALLLAAPAPAHADGTYFSLGMGPGEVSDDLGDYATDTFHARFAVGHRVGNLAVEGYLAPEFAEDGERSVNVELLRVGIDARYILPVNDNLQVYVRGGLSKMSATLPVDGRNFGVDEYSGRGIGGGVGAQLRGKVRALGFLYWPLFFIPVGPKVNSAIFVEHGMDFHRLHRETGPDRSIDVQITRLTIGFNVGADF